MAHNVVPNDNLKPRGNWYRGIIGKSLFLNVLLGSLLTFSIIANFWQFNQKPLPEHFATDAFGRITKIYALDRPNASDADILQWTKDALGDSNHWNFNDYKGRMQEICIKWFTKSGCAKFQAALEANGIVKYVTDNRLIVSGVVTKTPIIVKQDVGEDGLYYWDVQAPLLVTYEGHESRSPQGQIVELRIVRTSSLQKPRGIGIEFFTSKKSF